MGCLPQQSRCFPELLRCVWECSALFRAWKEPSGIFIFVFLTLFSLFSAFAALCSHKGNFTCCSEQKDTESFPSTEKRDEGKELSGSKTSCCCLFAASCKTSPAFSACQSHTSSLSPSGHPSEIPQMLTVGAAPIWGAGGVWDSLRVTFGEQHAAKCLPQALRTRTDKPPG